MKDIFEICHSIDTSFALFGAAVKAQEEFQVLTKAAGDAIMEEQGVTPEQAAALSPDTVLGEKAEAALKALEAFAKP
ncbi:MAG: hypothetical protein Q7S66_02225 [bacterium]|nr:hypothetical protein [bacterium]